MNFVSLDLARYAAYPDVVSFQVDARRYGWPLRPVRRIQGKNRYSLAEAVTAHTISVLRLQQDHHEDMFCQFYEGSNPAAKIHHLT